VKYAFIRAHQDEFAIRNLCYMLRIHRSGYYAWLNQPKSPRQKDDERLLGLIKQFWLESGCVYGYRKIHKDLREQGETCGRNRVARLMKHEGLKRRLATGSHATKAARSPTLLRTTSSRILMLSNPIRHGSQTLPTFAPTRAGYFWPLLSTCFRGRLSVGQCSPRCTLIWHSMLC
jgi:hypothetical protein